MNITTKYKINDRIEFVRPHDIPNIQRLTGIIQSIRVDIFILCGNIRNQVVYSVIPDSQYDTLYQVLENHVIDEESAPAKAQEAKK